MYGNELLSAAAFDLSMFQVAPNPVGDQLYLVSERDMANFTLEIYNIQGMGVLRPSSENISEKMIDVSMLSRGIYFLRIQDSLGQTEIKKFIKK